MQTNITTQTIDKINGNFFTGEVIKLPDYILDVLTQHALAITDERTPVDLDALSKDINFTIQAAGIMETSDITVYHGYVDKQPVSLVLKRGSDENWSINYETNLQAGMWIASNGFMYRQDETTQDDSHLYADPIGRLSA